MMLEKQTYKDSRFIKWSGQVVLVKINTDKQPKVAQKYQVTALPTLLFLDWKGKPIGSFLGFKPADEFISSASAILKKKGK